MPDSNPSSLSRRKWLGLMTPPVLAASLGAGLSRAGAADAAAAPGRNDLGTRTYNIRDYGAKGDGTTLDTAAIQAAIDACTADGGGTVLVPAGSFLIGTLELKSNVTFHLAASAKLLGSVHGADYHEVSAIPLSGDSTLGDGNWALIFAVAARNVTVEGPGTIDGQGAAFHPAVRGQTPPSGIGGGKRPYLLLFHKCENLVIRSIDLLESGYHCLRVIESSRCHFDGLYIHNRVSGNNDGFHFISAEHVTISNCTVKSQDDACALFGSCKFITVTNSTFSTRWSVFRFGGGIAENIAVSNCILYNVFGCPIKLHGRPGDRFENMSFSDLVLQNVTGPINISVGPYGRRRTAAAAAPSGAASTSAPGGAPEAPAQKPVSGQPYGEFAHSILPRDPGQGIVRNISFTNIRGTVTTSPTVTLPDWPYGDITLNPGEKLSAIVLNCVGDSTLENISFDNINLTYGGGGTAADGARRDIPKISGEYFELGPIPAYALYARNSRGITLNNVRFQVASQELRPAVILENVQDAAIDGLSVQGDAQAESVLRFSGVKDALLTAPRLLTPAATFLQVEGADNSGIIVDGGDLSKASAPLAFKAGAADQAVKLRT